MRTRLRALVRWNLLPVFGMTAFIGLMIAACAGPPTTAHVANFAAYKARVGCPPGGSVCLVSGVKMHHPVYECTAEGRNLLDGLCDYVPIYTSAQALDTADAPVVAQSTLDAASSNPDTYFALSSTPPAPGEKVTFQITRPDGTKVLLTATTDNGGYAKVALPLTQRGSYSVRVIDATGKWTYAPEYNDVDPAATVVY